MKKNIFHSLIILSVFFIFVSLIYSFFGLSYTQSEPLTWDKAYGGSGYEKAETIIPTKEGGYALAGSVQPRGVKKKDFWIIKINAQGELEWEKNYGEEGEEEAYSLIQTKEGGYTVAGYKRVKDGERKDFWIIKLNEKGSQEWNRIYGGESWERARSIIQTEDGGYLVVGETWSKGAGKADIWLLKLNSQGELKWDRTYGGRDVDLASKIIQTRNRDFIISGWTSSKGNGLFDIWILKMNPQGELKWDKTYGGKGDEKAYCIQQTEDGGYIIAGEIKSQLAGKSDAWIVKLDQNGNLQWEKRFGGNDNDRAYSITQTESGGYIFVGETPYQSAGKVDAWVVKLDDRGNILWNKTYGGRSYDEACSIIPAQDSGYVVAGGTRSKGAGSKDAWVIKIDENGEIK